MRDTDVLFTAGWMCALANSIVFFVSYYFMKIKKTLLWKFLIYLPVMVCVSVFFSGLTRELSRYWSFHHNKLIIIGDITVNLDGFMSFCAFMIFASLNYAAWRGLFKMNKMPAVILISLFISLINVAAYVIATPIYK